ncbi:MAG: hypothetical protein Q9213_005653 [Squamulea squamosa]
MTSENAQISSKNFSYHFTELFDAHGEHKDSGYLDRYEEDYQNLKNDMKKLDTFREFLQRRGNSVLLAWPGVEAYLMREEFSKLGRKSFGQVRELLWIEGESVAMLAPPS